MTKKSSVAAHQPEIAVQRGRDLTRCAVPSGGGRGRCLADGRDAPSVSGAGPEAGPVRAAARRPRVAGAGGRAGPPAPKTVKGRTAEPGPLCGSGGRNLHLWKAAVSAGPLCYRAKGRRRGAYDCARPGPSTRREPGGHHWSGPVRPGGAGRKEWGCFAASRCNGLVVHQALCDGGMRGGRRDWSARGAVRGPGGPGETSGGPGELRRGEWLLRSRLAAVYGSPGALEATLRLAQGVRQDGSARSEGTGILRSVLTCRDRSRGLVGTKSVVMASTKPKRDQSPSDFDGVRSGLWLIDAGETRIKLWLYSLLYRDYFLGLFDR
ncbi:hypothetical protein NDU88_008095 [Pleurodeles waltl]|uniref:Uncharacterized protein n=1 Tax=Pleurodeles waltl TaxID=8319 RepID=A0AAV7RV33_PLEWA|nr:hypothetical protein NDU88_008095 [Pleurodeles waltl]